MHIEMNHSWIYEFVIFLLFQSFNISLINTTDLFRTIQYPEEKILNISCWNTSKVQIQNISVQEEETTCRLNQCVLNVNDIQIIEDSCNGENSCLVDYNFTSACLREFRYIHLSYTCKYENRTSVSTFEEDFGDWMNVSSNSFTWSRTNLVRDHTMISSQGIIGYSMTAIFHFGNAGISRIDTDNEFMEPLCLSLWYQIYQNGYDCSFKICKISNGIQTLLFTAEGNSTIFNQWINISVDVYDQVPFKITLEAHFRYRNSTATRAILVDDTSIAHMPCKGQQITATCKDINKPIRIECEKQFLSGDINLSLEPTHLTSKQKDCQEKSIESELNTFCRNVTKSNPCEFNMSDLMSGYKDCYVTSKTITVTYQCRDITKGTEKTYDGSSFPYDIVGIVAGVFGGIVLTIIAVVVICRLKGLNGCECVTKNNAFPKRNRQESRITETGVYECSNISSRLSDHAYDSLECPNYYNMKNVINSFISVHHEDKGDSILISKRLGERFVSLVQIFGLFKR